MLVECYILTLFTAAFNEMRVGSILCKFITEASDVVGSYMCTSIIYV